MLKEMQEDTVAANKERQKQGFCAGFRAVSTKAVLAGEHPYSTSIVATPAPISRIWRIDEASVRPRCRPGIKSAIAT